MHTVLNRWLKKAQAVILAGALLTTYIIFGAVTGSAAQDSWKNYSAAGYASGNGTKESPFLISNAEQLSFFAQQVNTGSTYIKQYIKLTSDISLSGHQWVPIGYNYSWKAQNTFMGSFEGGGHSIIGLKIGSEPAKNNSYPYAGLFGFLSGDVQNLNVDGAVNSVFTPKNSSAEIGLLAGENYRATIKSCHVSGTVTGGKRANVGGLVGFNANAKLAGCSSSCTVSGGDSNDIGGLVGYSQAFSDPNNNGKGYFSIAGCSASGKVTGADRAGGLIGECSSDPACSVSILKCHASGNVSTDALSEAGGLIGSLTSAKAVVTACFASGDVSGGNESSSSGGFVGYLMKGTVRNSYAAGDVTVGDRRTMSGGFVGFNAGNVANSYATGAVHGGSGAAVGGFVGSGSGGAIQNCYAAGDVSGDGSAGIGGFAGVITGDGGSDCLLSKCYWSSAATQTVGKSQRDGSKKIGVGDASTSTCTVLTDDVMKSGFADTLNGNITALHLKSAALWKYASGKNGGMPVLGGL